MGASSRPGRTPLPPRRSSLKREVPKPSDAFDTDLVDDMVGLEQVPTTEGTLSEGDAASMEALSEVERFVLSKVDGKRAVSDIAVLVGLAPIEVIRVLRRIAELQPLAMIKVGAAEAAAELFLSLEEGVGDWEGSAPVVLSAEEAAALKRNTQRS